MDMKKLNSLFALCALLLTTALPAADKTYSLTSPDGLLTATVEVGQDIRYSLSFGSEILLAPSAVGMRFGDGTVFGDGDKVRKVSRKQTDTFIDSPVYKKNRVRDHYNEMTLAFKEFDLIFRAYDDGIAYRFVRRGAGAFTVVSEEAEFRFPGDRMAYIPYVRDKGTIESQFQNSFENTYVHAPLSGWDSERIAFLPLVVEAAGDVKILITESDLLDYPGMYLHDADGSPLLKGVFAPYPDEIVQGGHNMLQGRVVSRKGHIAEGSGTTAFPWRTVIVAANDKELLDSDMVWRLGTPSQGDFSWVKPGKVAWDWWNDWNLYGVDFRAGINNDTYKYYIDFAASQGIEYVILDEGWAVNLQADLMQVIPEIDIPMLAAYAEEKGVGLILWAGYLAFDRDMERVCEHYAKLGIKGFKIDFMDRDDQIVVDFYRRAAETCAKYGLLADFHGAFKPSGLNRTWPNVINFEGVNGLEQLKWADGSMDQVTYDVSIPFIRMAAGPMDYTQGAMRNAVRGNYRPVNSEAMSQGTRCHQLAEYVVFESPLNMLCDSPSNYLQEPECTRFIAEVPTVWDETVAIDGRIGEYAAIARRKGDTWYVGVLGGWKPRDMDLDLGFLPAGNWTVEYFRDGINADRAARDYKRETAEAPAERSIRIHLAPGGGWVAVFRPAEATGNSSGK